MSATCLRPVASSRFRRSRNRESVEALTERITILVAERQQLRAYGATDAVLERNRVRVARAHWELAHALIERHAVPRATRTAA